MDWQIRRVIGIFGIETERERDVFRVACDLCKTFLAGCLVAILVLIVHVIVVIQWIFVHDCMCCLFMLAKMC